MGLGANIRAGGAFVELYTKNNLLLSGLNNAGAAINKFGSMVTSLGMRLSAFGAIMTAPLIAAAKDFMDTGSALYLMSQRTGIAVEPLSQLTYAANQAGVETNNLEIFLRRMSHTIQQAADGVGLGAANLQSFGVSLHDIKNMSPDQILLKIADGFNKIENPVTRMARLKELGGRGGPLIAPLLMRGSEGIKELMGTEGGQAALRTLEQVKAAMALRQAWGDAKIALQSFVFTVGEALAPTFSQAFKAMMGYVAGARVWIADNSSLVKVALAAGLAIGGMGAALLGLGVAIKLTTVALIPLQLAGVLLGLSLNPIVLVGAAIGILADRYGLLAPAFEGLKASLSGLGEIFKTTWGGINDALKNNDWAGAAQIAIVGLKMAWQGFFDWFKKTWLGDVLGFVQRGFAFMGAIGMISSGRGLAEFDQFILQEQRRNNPAAFDENLRRLEEQRQRAIGAQRANDPDLLRLYRERDAAREAIRLGDPSLGTSAVVVRALENRLRLLERLISERQNALDAGAGTADIDRQIAARRAELLISPESRELREEMRGLLEEQGRLTRMREMGWNEETGRFGGTGLPARPIGDIDMSRAKTDAAGTFNAAALFGLGATSIQQQQLDAQEEIARNTGRIADNWGVQTV